jgi:hypothetical protein
MPGPPPPSCQGRSGRPARSGGGRRVRVASDTAGVHIPWHDRRHRRKSRSVRGDPVLMALSAAVYDEAHFGVEYTRPRHPPPAPKVRIVTAGVAWRGGDPGLARRPAPSPALPPIGPVPQSSHASAVGGPRDAVAAPSCWRCQLCPDATDAGWRSWSARPRQRWPTWPSWPTWGWQTRCDAQRIALVCHFWWTTSLGPPGTPRQPRQGSCAKAPKGRQAIAQGASPGEPTEAAAPARTGRSAPRR